jgi:hypothetical protein
MCGLLGMRCVTRDATLRMEYFTGKERAMSTPPLSSDHPIPTSRLSSSWLHARELWGGLAIISMWLAVLFVGVFGGNVVSGSPGGSSSSWPVVAVVAVVALLGTVGVERRAFGLPPASDDLRKAIEDERQAREQLAAEVSDLRAKLSG